jgi:hypothetical protein
MGYERLQSPAGCLCSLAIVPTAALGSTQTYSNGTRSYSHAGGRELTCRIVKPIIYVRQVSRFRLSVVLCWGIVASFPYLSKAHSKLVCRVKWMQSVLTWKSGGTRPHETWWTSLCGTVGDWLVLPFSLSRCTLFYVTHAVCRAIAQAVSHRLLTAEVLFRAQVSPCGILVDKVALGQFLLRFFPV